MTGLQFMEEQVSDPNAGVQRATLIGEGDDADPPQFVLGWVGAHVRRHVAGWAKSPRRRRVTTADAEGADEQKRATNGCEHAKVVSARHGCSPSFSPLAYGPPNVHTSRIIGVGSRLEQYAYQCEGLPGEYRSHLFRQGVTEMGRGRRDTEGDETSGAGDENCRQVSAGGQRLGEVGTRVATNWPTIPTGNRCG